MRRDEIVQFLQAIDAELALHITHGERLDLYLIGRSAPILRYGLDLATRDIDIVHVHGSALEGRALEQFGKGTRNAERGTRSDWASFSSRYHKGWPRSQAVISTGRSTSPVAGAS